MDAILESSSTGRGPPPRFAGNDHVREQFSKGNTAKETRNMKPQIPRSLVPVLLAATIPATAIFAQTPLQPPQQKQERPARLSPDARARLQDGRIAMMKESLKLNDDQLKLWAPVEQQIRAGFAARQREFQDWEQRRQQATVPPSLPDRLDRASQRMAERSLHMQAFAAVFRPFYASLTDEQKMIAGVVLRGMRGGFRGPGHRWAMRRGADAPQPQQ
jgi:LTXXQ motif family protein